MELGLRRLDPKTETCTRWGCLIPARAASPRAIGTNPSPSHASRSVPHPQRADHPPRRRQLVVLEGVRDARRRGPPVHQERHVPRGPRPQQCSWTRTRSASVNARARPNTRSSSGSASATSRVADNTRVPASWSLYASPPPPAPGSAAGGRPSRPSSRLRLRGGQEVGGRERGRGGQLRQRPPRPLVPPVERPADRPVQAGVPAPARTRRTAAAPRRAVQLLQVAVEVGDTGEPPPVVVGPQIHLADVPPAEVEWGRPVRRRGQVPGGPGGQVPGPPPLGPPGDVVEPQQAVRHRVRVAAEDDHAEVVCGRTASGRR